MAERDRTAAVAGLLAVAAFVAGQYVAPALVWPEEQVGGVQRSFYASFEGRLLAQSVLFGLAAGLRAAVVVAAGAVAAGHGRRRPAGPRQHATTDDRYQREEILRMGTKRKLIICRLLEAG